jgi:hypothetical protein
MELTAIYDNGRLHFAGPFRLKMERISVKVLVDDEAVLRLDAGDSQEPATKEKPAGVLQRVHSLLGSDYEYVPTDETDKEMLKEALKERFAK